MIRVLTGLRAPIVVILLLTAIFTWISGKPLDGALLALVAGGLAWDTGRRARAAPAATASSVQAALSVAAGSSAERPGEIGSQPLAGLRWPLIAALLAGGALYAVVVGSFSRYSWPATAGVAGLGAAVVAGGWPGPPRGRFAGLLRGRLTPSRAQPARDDDRARRRGPGPLPLGGTLAWAGLLVAGGLWELASLLQQPDLTTGSAAHPTISTLTDPLLSWHGGRSLALAIWLALGWYLVEL
jgi:hypothetical protein